MTRLNKLSFVLICATGIFTTLAYGTVHQPVIAFFYAIVTVMGLVWASDCLINGEVRFSRSPLQIPLLLLGVYALIQIVPFGTVTEYNGIAGVPRTISVEPFATQVTALHIFALCAFFALALAALDSSARVRRLATVITVFGFVYGFYAILQMVLSPDKIYGIYKPQSAVPFGSFVNRHDFAAVMEMSISVPLGMMFAGAVRSDKKLLYVVAIVLMGSSLLLSGSRGGLIALIAEIILLVILTTRAKGRNDLILKIALSGLLVISAVGGAVFVGGDTSLTRFSEAAAADDISSSRTQIWGVTLNVIAANMPFGAGLGAYAQAYTKSDTASGYERVEQAHNDYLQVAADAGLVGLVLGALFLFWFFREGIRNAAVTNAFRRGIAVGSFAGCFAILIHSLFDFVLHITAVSVMFLTLMSMLVAAGREYDDDTDEFDNLKDHERRRKLEVSSGSVVSIGERLPRRLKKD